MICPIQEICYPTSIFSEDGDLHCTRSIKDDFKKDFGAPVYDEYEEEHPQTTPEEPYVEPKFDDKENQPLCSIFLLIVWRLRKNLRCPRNCQIMVVLVK